ncbi:MAG: MoxR family ATPase [Deltaproteobacteria bacterium]|nr:MAG: MoxR family ATPase [Deltaproteobacteria bacterium]
MDENIRLINEKIERESAFLDRLTAEVGKVLVGQRHMLDRILIGLLCNGHVLLEGVPGLAKTMTIKTLADCIDAKFQRIQFTPDLLPADLIGTMVYNQKSGEFQPKLGPVFANFVLADEINRAPAKVQSALLEAMQERQVTIGDTTHELPHPFLVLATQNPIEQEGTYPLPEAQVDRFMLKVLVDYPDRDEERQIMQRMTASRPPQVQAVITLDDIVRAQGLLHEVYVDKLIDEYILDIVFATRRPVEYHLEQLQDFIEYGASPRASIYLKMAARAHAFLRHRGYVTPEDVKSVAPDVLRHRIIPTYEAEAEEMDSDAIIRMVFEQIASP